MEFKTNHCTLYPSVNPKPNKGCGIKLPTDRDYYFRAKQFELLDQYSAARFFLSQTEAENYKSWLLPGKSDESTQGIQYVWKSYFYEAALMYYNILVDLSWTICYLSAEFVCYKNGTANEFDSVKSLGEAEELMRAAEALVNEPTSSTNPLKYILKVRPEFSKAIQMVNDFWKNYKESPVRNKYNYCKHRGKPSYTEIANLRGPKIANHFIKFGNGHMVQTAFDTRDVRYETSLEDSIIELQKFDDEMLFPYLEKLLHELERLVDPSPWAF